MKVKRSYYTIITDTVDSNGNKVLYSTRTGKVMLISALVAEYLDDRIEDIPEAIIEKLKAISAVVPEEENELLEIVTENKEEIENEKNNTLYEVIQPSAMCQLGCYYCGQDHVKTNISLPLTQQLLERIQNKIYSGNYKDLFIGWFGAEPLMALAQIREITKQLKMLSEENSLTYSCKMISNGLSLKKDVFIELVKEHGMKEIEVTLDGTKEGHDAHRYTKKNGPSFDLIFKNLKEILSLEDFKSLGCKVSIRCNVDEKNHHTVLPLIKLLASHHLHDKIAFYITGVYSWGNDAHKKALSKEEFAINEAIWLMEMTKLGFHVNLIPRRKKKVCIAVSNVSEMYDAYGNIFNCTEVSYVPAYKNSVYTLGNLNNPGEVQVKNRPLSDWNDTVLTEKFPCHTCKMLPVCGGACPKSWHEDMRACPSAKFNILERLKIAHVMGTSQSMPDMRKKVENLLAETKV